LLRSTNCSLKNAELPAVGRVTTFSHSVWWIEWMFAAVHGPVTLLLCSNWNKLDSDRGHDMPLDPACA